MDRATRRTSDIATDASAAEHEDPRLDHGGLQGARPVTFHLILILILILIRFFGSAQIPRLVRHGMTGMSTRWMPFG
jgi:hypothetical protein